MENHLQVELTLQTILQSLLMKLMKEMYLYRIILYNDDLTCCYISTDVLLGLLKQSINRWPHLRVVVTSATLDILLINNNL